MRSTGARSVARALSPLFAALLWVCAAQADDDQRLGLSLKTVVAGNDVNAIVIRPVEAVKTLSVRLAREGQPPQKLGATNVAAGAVRELEVRQPEGTFSYDAQFDVVWDDGSASTVKTTFKLTRVGKLKLDITPADVDLDARKMSFRMNNPGQKAELVIMGKDGQKLGGVEKQLDGSSGGTPLALAWDAVQGDVLYMDLKVTDVAGFWTGVRLTPFSIEIPHEEVEFATGKWDIRTTEEPKLVATMGKIKEAIAKHGTLLQLKLYVAGCTDTVGSPASNQTLSENRARSIGAWFRKSGLSIPIFYEGLGEEALAKKTPDETAEAKNRRAIYVLSTQKPAGGANAFKDAWKPL